MSIPGFVDLQVNGYKGTDFSQPSLSKDDFLKAADGVLSSGTALFLPTLVTSGEDVYMRNIELIHSAVSSRGLEKQIPGVHMEGPFISPEPGAVGAHDKRFVRKPDCDFFARILEKSGGFVKILTVAAETENVDSLIKYAVSRGITVSCGHQLADSTDIHRAAEAGATLLTHLANGCPNMLNRHNNPIWAGLATDSLTAMIITDGHHLPADVVKVIVRVKGPDKVIITSDAASVAGLKPGRYNMWGNNAVLEENGLFHDPAKGCLCGSSAMMRDCVNFIRSLEILDGADIEKLSYYNPLRAIGML